jgi:hypothetical protein
MKGDFSLEKGRLTDFNQRFDRGHGWLPAP